ncbi:transforming growth factor, beta receptor associated protein 1 [Chamberlinius hualienensis]
MLNSFNLEFVQSGLKIKNISLLCVNENPMVSNPFCMEISVCRKRSVHVYHVTEDTAIHRKEISLSEAAVAMAMDGVFVCVATVSKYCMVNVESETVLDVLPFDATSYIPLVVRISRQEFIINGPNNLGVFVTSSGTSERPPIVWSKGVKAMTFVHPYVITLQDVDQIAIYSILDQKQKQIINFQNGGCLENFQGRILVGSSCSLYMLVSVPCGSQVRALLTDGHVNEALELAKHCHWPGLSREQFLKVYKRIQQEAGFIQLAKFRFQEANELFLAGQLDPREIATLFPSLLPVNSEFVKAVPTLHSLANINHMCQGDSDKIQKSKLFLINLLQDTKDRRNSVKWKQDIEVILLKLYAEMGHQALNQLVVNCHSTLEEEQTAREVVDWLTKYERHHALALFLKHKQRNDQSALEIWSQLITGQIVDGDFPGITFFLQQLTELKDVALMLKYADVVLKAEPELAVSIFTNRDEDQLKADDVVEYLNKFPITLMKYLEHLVYQIKTQKERYYTQLAMMYLDEIKHSSDETENSSWRRNLQNLLENSSLYRVQFVLSRVEALNLHLEASILYGKLNEHDKALGLLVHQLNDWQAAVRHCEFYSKGKNCEYKKQIFTQLLRIYLDPQLEVDRQEELFHPAMELLNSESADFDLVSVLSILPTRWSVGAVDTFLHRILAGRSSESRRKLLEKNLAKVENVQVKWKLYLQRRSPIYVNEEDACDICGKSLDESSVVRFPSGHVTHVSCSNKVQQPKRTS